MKRMESKTPAMKSRTRVVDQMTFRTMIRLCVVVDITGIAGLILLRQFIPQFSLPFIYSILIILLLAIGCLYSIIGWKRVNASSPTLAINLAFTPIAISALLAIISTGGLNSAWFMMWFVIIIMSGLAGSRSTAITAGLTALLIVIPNVLSGNSSLNSEMLIRALSAGVAVCVAFMVGKSMDRMAQTMQVAEGLSKELDGSSTQQQLMLGAIADAVVAVDCDQNVVMFNAAAQKLTGWDEKSAKGIHYNLIFKLHDQKDAELSPANDPFGQAISTQQPFSTDQYYMLDKNNQKISFSIAIAPTNDATGKVNGAIGVFHDISEQKAAARERNEFISTASHEMRTPVAAIEGYLAMAMNPKLAETDERAKNFIGKAHDASVHLGRLFRDLLSVTKIEDRRLTIKIGSFNLTDLLRSVVTEMDIIAHAKSISLESPFSQAAQTSDKRIVPAYMVRADPDRLREVLSNLIDNAIKYSQPNSSVKIDISTNSNFAEVRITDHGIGISAEDQKHLFQKFYRVNNSYTREVGGTGLGLYIARNLIELFGGKIWLESEEGKGTTFHFTLPLDKQHGL